MYCQNCGTKNTDTASFCKDCGESLDHSKSIKKTAPTQQAQPLMPTQSQPVSHQAVQGVSRFIKVVFYFFYIVMLFLVPAVVWEASIGRVCQPGGYMSSGQFVLGQCVNTTTGLVLWRNAIFALFITYAVFEVIKSMGIYITSGTKFKDQNTFFMQAMHENNRKKSKK